jgi:hypothetical protein
MVPNAIGPNELKESPLPSSALRFVPCQISTTMHTPQLRSRNFQTFPALSYA